MTQSLEFDYVKARKYDTKAYNSMIMGPHPLKLLEELMNDHKIKRDTLVCDLGSGNGLTSVFLAKEYGFKVKACDLWSDPKVNQKFFESEGLTLDRLEALKVDAENPQFEKEYFDAVISVDAYNYFGRDESYLDEKLLPFVKTSGLIYICVPSMLYNFHENYPEELLLSWNKDQLAYLQGQEYWTELLEKSKDSSLLECSVMKSKTEVWLDWIKQDNEYAINDRKSINGGALKYLFFLKIVLQKH